MKRLEPPDTFHLDAAQGWLGLGDWLEANEELESITPHMRAHPDMALLFVAQIAAQFQQFLEQFLDVPAAGVVGLNQFLELLREIGARLVQANQLFQLGTDGGFEDFQVGVLVLRFLEAASQTPRNPPSSVID